MYFSEALRAAGTKSQGRTVLILREIEPPQNHNRLFSEIALNGFIRGVTGMRSIMH